jgi:hypothetical protein
MDGDVDRRDRHRHQADRAGDRRPPVDRDREQRDGARERGRRGVDVQRRHEQRDADRPAPSLPQRQRGERAADEVIELQLVAHRVHRLGEHEEAADDGDQEARDVDDPVARGAPVPPGVGIGDENGGQQPRVLELHRAQA